MGESHKQKQNVLHMVSGELDRKRGALQHQLDEFNERFEEAKAQREQVISEHDKVRDTLGGFLPDYFQLQTEQAGKRRELEQVKREHELLTWEHHKVERDLDMLTKSYDLGYLPPLPGASPH